MKVVLQFVRIKVKFSTLNILLRTFIVSPKFCMVYMKAVIMQYRFLKYGNMMFGFHLLEWWRVTLECKAMTEYSWLLITILCLK